MPTTAERHALLFLAALAVTGAGVRLQQSWTLNREVDRAFPEAPRRTLADRAVADRAVADRAVADRAVADRAVAAQLATVDSARSAPRQRATRPQSSRTIPHAARTVRAPAPPPEPVPVNRATAQELERLPGIGPALAKRMLAYRERHGPFRSLEDLLGVPGIGKGTAAKLAASVTF